MKKRLLTTIIALATIATLLIGCAEKRECDFCGEEAKCSTISFWGEELYICRECEEELSNIN